MRVSWSIRDERLELELRETGGPAVTAPARRGFGLRVLFTGLPRSLGGEASLDFAPGGVRYSLSAPLSAAIRTVRAD